jgi:hypothetical protein
VLQGAAARDDRGSAALGETLAYWVPIKAEMAVAPTPRPLASCAVCAFQASNPPDELPHCAACAGAPRPASSANAANAAVITVALIMQNSLRTISGEA